MPSRNKILEEIFEKCEGTFEPTDVSAYVEFGMLGVPLLAQLALMTWLLSKFSHKIRCQVKFMFFLMTTVYLLRAVVIYLDLRKEYTEAADDVHLINFVLRQLYFVMYIFSILKIKMHRIYFSDKYPTTQAKESAIRRLNCQFDFTFMLFFLIFWIPDYMHLW